MSTVDSIEELEQLYQKPVPTSLAKVADRVTPLYKQWIEASRFLVLSSVGPEGCDASPRGDKGSVSAIIDDKTLWLPDWKGNNRLDSVRNIIRDGRVSLMFMVPGCNNVVRINGTALITTDENTIKQFEVEGKTPTTVIVVTVGEIYFQCAKALMRSALWSSNDESEHVPTAGEFIREADNGFDAETYDSGYVENAKDRMW